jgi:hypothetical protein
MEDAKHGAAFQPQLDRTELDADETRARARRLQTQEVSLP